MTNYQRIPIEILVKDQPYRVVDVPVLGEVTEAEVEKAERRALWAIIAQGQYEPEEITARYAPELAAEEA